MIWKEINILLSLYDFEQNYSNYYIPFFTINFKEKYQTKTIKELEKTYGRNCEGISGH